MYKSHIIYEDSFRLQKAEVDGHVVELVPSNEINSSSNYYTLVIGNNGSGKSRLLNSIIHMMRDNKKYPFKTRNGLSTPARTIIITNSQSDRYPLDRATIDYRDQTKHNTYIDEDYIYLGAKMRFGTYSSKYRLDRALRICAEQYQSSFVASSFRRIFAFLDYQPIVKISYELKDRTNYQKSNSSKYHITPFDSYQFLENEKVSPRLREILEKLSHSKMYQHSFIYNFSEKHMTKESMSHLSYEYEGFAQELLDFILLRKAQLIKNYKISVYKISGKEFSFDDASSGEANILTSFLSLIPLLRDKSLILFDEPEISLHPQWQSSFISLLKEVMKGYRGCHVIIASHSHLMVSDLMPEDSSVVVMGRDNKGGITSSFYENDTYGWSAENILLNVFGVPAARNYYFANQVQKLLNIMASQKKDMNQYRKSLKEVLAVEPYLSESDPLKEVVKMLKEYEQAHK